jgi:hypothetical protein
MTATPAVHTPNATPTMAMALQSPSGVPLLLAIRTNAVIPRMLARMLAPRATRRRMMMSLNGGMMRMPAYGLNRIPTRLHSRTSAPIPSSSDAIAIVLGRRFTPTLGDMVELVQGGGYGGGYGIGGGACILPEGAGSGRLLQEGASGAAGTGGPGSMPPTTSPGVQGVSRHGSAGADPAAPSPGKTIISVSFPGSALSADPHALGCVHQCEGNPCASRAP